MSYIKAHRGAGDAAYIMYTDSNYRVNIWWGHRRWFWLAKLIVWVFARTQEESR